jgi:hypothetical protein
MNAHELQQTLGELKTQLADLKRDLGDLAIILRQFKEGRNDHDTLYALLVHLHDAQARAIDASTQSIRAFEQAISG